MDDLVLLRKEGGKSGAWGRLVEEPSAPPASHLVRINHVSPLALTPVVTVSDFVRPHGESDIRCR